MIGAPQSQAEVRAALEAVLAREGLPRAPRRPNAFLRWLGESLDGMGELGGWLDFLSLLLAGLLLFSIWRLWRGRIRGLGRQRVGAVEQLRRQRAAELLQQARAARAAQAWAEALRLEVAALLVGLGEAGALEYRSTWTLHELLARGRPRQELQAPLERLVAEVEPLCFGRASIGRAEFERVRGLLEACRAEVRARGGGR